MLQYQRKKTGAAATFAFLALLYHSTVRVARGNSGNAVVGLVVNILQTMLMVAIFYLMFSILGLRGMALRGNFLLYLMTGIVLFMTHIRTMSAVLGSEGPTSQLMNHAPMTTTLSIASSALAQLYLQVLSMVVLVFIMHVVFGSVDIYDPPALILPIFLAWFSGLSVGVIFLAIKPWFPSFTGLASQIYMRANMIASGKMFVANSLPAAMLPYFSWNPLFHTIDQARGAAFINYNPHNTSISYPMYVSLALIVVGLMGEFWARKHVSASRGKR